MFWVAFYNNLYIKILIDISRCNLDYIHNRILTIDSKRYLYTNVHCYMIHSRKRWKTIQMAMKSGVYKHAVVYTDNGIWFSLIKEILTCYNADDPWRHYAKCNKPDTKGQIFHDLPFLQYLEESYTQN